MDNLIDKAAGYLLRNHRRQRWKQIVSVLAAIVVFVTTYALILPAITFESNSDISQGEYMYPVSDEQGEKYEIADSGGESDGAQEENAASTDAQYTAAQEHTSSEDSEKPEETAEPEEAAEPSKDTQEPHGTESRMARSRRRLPSLTLKTKIRRKRTRQTTSHPPFQKAELLRQF